MKKWEELTKEEILTYLTVRDALKQKIKENENKNLLKQFLLR